MKRTFCDKCGAEIRSDRNFVKLKPEEMDCEGGTQTVWRAWGTQDLCDDCSKEYVKFVFDLILKNPNVISPFAVNLLVDEFNSKDIIVKEDEIE